jgi:hypothetical protein
LTLGETQPYIAPRNHTRLSTGDATLETETETLPLQEARIPDRSSRPGPDSILTLAAGVRLEPLGDGSAVLYSKELDQSLSLNHTAALLCSFADGRHTLSTILQEMRQTFPETSIEESDLVAFLGDLVARNFLQWGA